MTEKPRLKFWQIWNMSFGFFGIQFGWGLQMANMSAIYQYLGADEGDIPLLWLAAPLTGLIVQPIIGYMSDRTWTGFGRRRPYFLVGAILASIALVLMPNSSSLWMAAGLLWILDASVNISMEPFRAFVGDMLPKRQRKSGFAMQSVLIGLGAVLSSALPYILTKGFGFSSEAGGGSAIPPAIKYAFYVGAFVFFLAVLYTVLTTKEYSPDEMKQFEGTEDEEEEKGGFFSAFGNIIKGICTMPRTMRQLAPVQFCTWLGLFCMWIFFSPTVGKRVFDGQPMGVNDDGVNVVLDSAEAAKEMAVAAVSARKYRDLRKKLTEEQGREGKPQGIREITLALLGMGSAPPDPAASITAKQLAGIINTSRAADEVPDDETRKDPLVRSIAAILVADKAKPGDPGAELHQRLAAARNYQEGINWAGVCFAAYNFVAFCFAFILLALVKFFSARMIHVVCLGLAGLGLISVLVFNNQYLLLVSMTCVGIGWASILSMPYALLSNSLPGNKMGFYMGVFNFFIVLPQILASVGLGWLVSTVFGGNSVGAIVMGGVAMAIAAGLTLLVNDAETEGIEEPAR